MSRYSISNVSLRCRTTDSTQRVDKTMDQLSTASKRAATVSVPSPAQPSPQARCESSTILFHPANFRSVQQSRDDAPDALAVQARDADEEIVRHLHVREACFEVVHLEAAEDGGGCQVELRVGQAF